MNVVSKQTLINKATVIDKHDQLFGHVTKLIDDTITLLILTNTDINKWINLDGDYIPANEYHNYILGKGELTAEITIIGNNCSGTKPKSNLDFNMDKV